jgi:hypothetical protein
MVMGLHFNPFPFKFLCTPFPPFWTPDLRYPVLAKVCREYFGCFVDVDGRDGRGLMMDP